MAWPSHVRSIPELNRLRTQLRHDDLSDGGQVLAQLFLLDAGADPETLRRHTFETVERLPRQVAKKAPPGAEAIIVSSVSTLIRSGKDGERHLEVRVDNVETASRRRQVLGAVTQTDTDPAVLIRHGLGAVGRTVDTALTAFTNGCCGF